MRESSARSAAIRARSPSLKSFTICCSSLSTFIASFRAFLWSPVSVQAGIPKEASVIRMFRALALLLFFTIALPILSHAQAAPATSDKPFVVEYYYKAKWGHADEFLKLFKKNHYPLLKKGVEAGRMVKVWMDQPRYHTTEDGRWDFRVTIVFKNAAVASEP